VFGKCLCVHHTEGDHCERCGPLYNDRPWRPANGSSGGISGGVCNDCQHNTEGRRCQRCRHGYHRHPSKPLRSPHACTRKSCWCDPQGSLPPPSGEVGPWCDPKSGQCRCKSGVEGMSCSHCLPGYWGFGEDGCKPCACPHSCDPTTGHCLNR
ncbi:hypothetical protein XENOCAPTIV_019917, partial [Xenoophorus captivus]